MRATSALENTLERMKIPFKRIEGEAAFYGPKIDIKLIDAIGRPWQLTTVQFDFNLPARFGLEYVGEDGARHQPLMVHRALLGIGGAVFWNFDRALCRGVSAWLAPVQVELLPVSNKFSDYAKQVDASCGRREFACTWTTATKNCRRKSATRKCRRFPTC